LVRWEIKDNAFLGKGIVRIGFYTGTEGFTGFMPNGDWERPWVDESDYKVFREKGRKGGTEEGRKEDWSKGERGRREEEGRKKGGRREEEGRKKGRREEGRVFSLNIVGSVHGIGRTGGSGIVSGLCPCC
jgi:hypothetical protein